MLNIPHNPDILTCLADLSSDEVFTPPDVANQMLDQLPKEIWSDDSVTFIDPVSKSGVFLREITKRLLDGLESKIPDIEQRLEHILKKQVFGIATTRLTSQISRRTLYCSKNANGEYSIVDFIDEEGNLKYFESQHFFADGIRCKYCGVKKKQYQRDKGLEIYAYSFIHEDKPEELFNMKFDVIIGNPPYQMSTGGSGAQATPVYNKFVETAKRLKPRYLSMIIPSRWFSGGMGLNEFRKSMLNDKRIKKMVDYPNSKDCFNGVSISGGVNYFLWERDYSGNCEFVSRTQHESSSMQRDLSEFKYLIRDNIGAQIIKRMNVSLKESMVGYVSSINPFNLKTSFRGSDKNTKNSLKVFHSKGYGFIEESELTSGKNLVNKYKVLLSQTTSEHAGEPSQDGKYKLFSKLEVLKPNEISTFSYLILGEFDNEEHAKNLRNYLETKFARFLVLQAISSIHITRDKFIFLPKQDFSKQLEDKDLYKKYNLSNDEIQHIEKLIKEFN